MKYVLAFLCFCFVVKTVWYVINSIECPKCGTDMVGHSHSELLGTTWVEVYECKNCKNKYI